MRKWLREANSESKIPCSSHQLPKAIPSRDISISLVVAFKFCESLVLVEATGANEGNGSNEGKRGKQGNRNSQRVSVLLIFAIILRTAYQLYNGLGVLKKRLKF
jgi:hypothetical protein